MDELLCKTEAMGFTFSKPNDASSSESLFSCFTWEISLESSWWWFVTCGKCHRFSVWWNNKRRLRLQSNTWARTNSLLIYYYRNYPRQGIHKGCKAPMSRWISSQSVGWTLQTFLWSHSYFLWAYIHHQPAPTRILMWLLIFIINFCNPLWLYDFP